MRVTLDSLMTDQHVAIRFQTKCNLEMLFFLGWRKPEKEPAKDPHSEQERGPTKNATHESHDLNLGHTGGRQVL